MQENLRIFGLNHQFYNWRKKILFRCCSRLDERLGWGEASAGGRDIEVLLSGAEQRTGEGETMRYDVARGWLPNMIISGKDCPKTWCCLWMIAQHDYLEEWVGTRWFPAQELHSSSCSSLPEVKIENIVLSKKHNFQEYSDDVIRKNN